MARIEPAILSQMLANNIESLIEALGFPTEQRTKSGDRLGCLNFVRGEKNAGSFWINVSGSQKGKWIDFVDPDNLRGDALSLVYYSQTGQPKPSSASQWRIACEWAERWLGVAGSSAAFDLAQSGELARVREVADLARAGQQMLEAKAIGEERKRMKARWLKAELLHPQTRAWAYLLGRGIDMARLQDDDEVPGAIRFEPEGIYAWDPDAKKATTYPTMICGMWALRPDGAQEFAGVHMTFLDRDSDGKADVKAVRKMRPKGINGAFIPISKGADGLATGAWIKAAAVGAKLIITEGVEDALTQAMMYPDVRVWAAGSVWNMGAVTIPGHVSDVILVGDNDTGKDAKRAFHSACVKINTQLQAPDRIGGKGRLIVRRAIGWKDFNDALQAKIARDGGEL